MIKSIVFNIKKENINIQPLLDYLKLMKIEVFTISSDIDIIKPIDIDRKKVLFIEDTYSGHNDFIKLGYSLQVLITDEIDQGIDDRIIVKHIDQILSLFEIYKYDGITELLEIESFESLRSKVLYKYIHLLDNLNDVYIFGAKTLGEKTLTYCNKRSINTIAFIDNNTSLQHLSINGKKVIGIDELHDKKDATIIIATTIYMYEIIQQLEVNGFKNYIPYPVLTLLDETVFLPQFPLNYIHRELIANKFKYIMLFSNLGDSTSREILDCIIKFRLTLEISYMNSAFSKDSDQYFDKELIQLSEKEVFLDGGGFNGDTAKQFIETVKGEYRKILFFEPDPKLINLSRTNLKDYKNIEFYEKGLFSRSKTLKFSSTGRHDGQINDNGQTYIEVISIDEQIKDDISFIKLDIEGAEKEALIGARNHLINEEPKLAIAGYHKSEDIWSIPQLISSINDGYKFYIRHYTRNVDDTVIYAIKK